MYTLEFKLLLPGHSKEFLASVTGGDTIGISDSLCGIATGSTGGGILGLAGTVSTGRVVHNG